MNFKIDDKVTWTSQSSGHVLTKTGIVIGIVPAGQRPDEELFSGKGSIGTRKEESYIVRVKGRGTYWPLTQYLRPIKSARVVIILDGGLVQSVYLDGSGAPTKALVIDMDTDSMDEKELTVSDDDRAFIHTETIEPLNRYSHATRLMMQWDSDQMLASMKEVMDVQEKSS